MKAFHLTSKGFTLVEIMIVVVIIGLLATMAIPAFQRVAQSTVAGTMKNDAAKLGQAAQQYWLEHPENLSVAFSLDPLTGAVDPASPLVDYVHTVSKGLTGTNLLHVGGTFTLSHVRVNSGAPVSFTEEGKITP